MERIKVKVKRLYEDSELPLPSYHSKGSSGLDIRAYIKIPQCIEPGEFRLIPTGLAISIPRGYEAQIRPRSGLALKHGIGLANSPGTIDSDYRGEIGLIMINWGTKPFFVKMGDRIAQMVFSRVCQGEFVEVKNLDTTARGSGGFGHTGIE